MRVGIIGAGIGGACLAHGLRKNGIDVAVFERNSESSPGLPGYGIHINPFGQQAMQECLPEANWRAFVGAAKPIGGAARFYDTDLRLIAQQDGVHVKDGKTIREDRLSISRSELKDALNAGLSNVVRFDKQFRRYENVANGRVRLYFVDGSEEDVDVLVGADGSNSKVRKQYLPSIERFDVGVDIIVGRSRLTSELAASLPRDLIDGSPNSIVPRSSDWMFTSVWRAPVDTSGKSDNVQIDTFSVWAYITATKNLPANIAQMSPQELCDLALLRTATWDENLHSLIRQSDMSSVSLVPLRSMPHLPSWKSSNVTLLGDAIHNMTPMAGVGANTALRDARLLSIALANVESGRETLVDAISRYEAQMRDYANRSVAMSLRNAQNASPSPFKRRVFLFILRLAQAFPFVKRRLFAPGK